MRKFKIWLLERFLPAWAEDSIYRQNEFLRKELDERAQEIRELNAYIDGMETALRSMRRIVIQNGVKR